MNLSIGFVDSHCHLSDSRVFEKSDELIARAKKAGVVQIGIGGVEPAEWTRQKVLVKKYPDLIKTSFGIHPWWIETQNKSGLEDALLKLKQEGVHADAIGEAGLDFHERRNKERFADQEWIFREQIKLALELKKPLIIHCVQAHEEVLKIIEETGANAVPILVHSFSGGPEQATKWLELGATLSFSGAILKKDRYKKVKEALLEVPMERIVFETDAPDQYWFEGQSEPAYVEQVLTAAAKMRGDDVDELHDQAYFNFCDIFRASES